MTNKEMRTKLPKIITVVGPTASGKSDLAVEIALQIGGEVISADSRQVYRGLDIGSGKITKFEMRRVPHHLLDVADPKKQFSVVQYRQHAIVAITDILARGKVPIICGGTGFYIDALVGSIVIPEVPPNKMLRAQLGKKNATQLFLILQKLDPRRAGDVDAQNPVRLIRAIEIARSIGSVPRLEERPPSWDVLQIGIKTDKEKLREKISLRLTKRMRKGMLAEGRRLHAHGLSWKRMRALGLEYRALADILTKSSLRPDIEQRLITEICQYAKRQMTWFKRTKTIKWFALSEKRKIIITVKKFLNKN